MLYSYKQLLKKYKTRYNIKKAIDNQKIFKLEHNIYSDKKIVNPLILYSKRYPYGIITMNSAFYLYNLTDVIPTKVYIATPSKYRIIKNKEIIQIFTNKEILNMGKVKYKIGNEYIMVYNKERLLVELIRKRKQISFDYYKEIISNYREIADELDIQKIEKYLSLYKNDLNLAEALQREVF